MSWLDDVDREEHMTRRTFVGSVGALLTACALPAPFLTDMLAPTRAGLPADGWVTIARPCTIRGYEITLAQLQQMVANFKAPLPLDVNFNGQQCGWVTDVKMAGDELRVRLELPSFGRALFFEHKAVVPAFVADPRSYSVGCRLVAAALTNHPAV